MVFHWSSQIPDFNLNEMLWLDLMRAVHKQVPANHSEPKRRCKQNLTKDTKIQTLLLMVVLHAIESSGVLIFLLLLHFGLVFV